MPVEIDGVAAELQRVAFLDRNALVRRHQNLDQLARRIVECGGKKEERAIRQGAEACVEMIETGIDEVQRRRLTPKRFSNSAATD